MANLTIQHLQNIIDYLQYVVDMDGDKCAMDLAADALGCAAFMFAGYPNLPRDSALYEAAAVYCDGVVAENEAWLSTHPQHEAARNNAERYALRAKAFRKERAELMAARA